MPRFAIGFCLICLTLLSPNASAAVVGYQYSGIVNFVSPAPPPPFGVTVPSTAAASGAFWYDTGAIGTASGANSVLYPQNHWLTLTLSAPGFQGVVAKSYGYVMEVSNDLPQPAGGPIDRVSFLFDSNLSPSSYWQVNDLPGENEPPLSGLLRLNFKASAAARADASIPADLSFAPLPQTNQLFGDAPIGVPDVIFMILSLSSLPASAEPPSPVRCPEPSGLVLIGLGAAFVGGVRWKRRVPAVER